MIPGPRSLKTVYAGTTKKLCHVLFEEYPKDSRVRRYTNALVDNGFTVYVVCLSTPGASFAETRGSVKIYRIPLKKRRGGFVRRLWEYLLFQIAATAMVNFVALWHGARIFHIHTLPDFLVFSCLFPKLIGAQIILDFHELFPEFMLQHKPSLKNSFMIRILELQERLSFTFADKIITIHEPAMRILQARNGGPKPITVVMNAVDESEVVQIKKEKTDRFKIIYNGTINFNLNLSFIIEALSILKDSNPEIYEKMEFHLYGDGPDLKNILACAARLNITHMYFNGRLEFSKMVKEIAASSLCILPPSKDIYSDLYYSLKLTEMIYWKVPVIATRLNTYVRYYPEDCVLYFESGNVVELAEKMVFAFNNPDKIQVLTENALREYQKYNWEKMRDRYLRLIGSMITV